MIPCLHEWDRIVYICIVLIYMFFFFSSRRRHTRSCLVSWARRCVQETDQRRVHGKSSTNEYLLLIKKQSRGSSTVDAQKNVEEIEYNFTLKDSTLRFDPYYMLKDKARWRNQEVYLTLKVPEGKSVYLNQKMTDIISNIENIENMWDGDMVGKTWTMTADGLSLKKEIPLKLSLIHI
eukprot:TRINITY_DN15400_c0_g1_i1.p2 TRINITY_DN15400_c0_g1~~TRINITY_DN15400_c0_g1_i1.p2  ORF type:complete len:178 (-),score=19.80 TRINITY_DN15400_c0_g1_i1:121-654(-)